MIDWKYPMMFSIDTKSDIKSLWLGWWLITWSWWPERSNFFGEYEIDISFQPGL